MGATPMAPVLVARQDGPQYVVWCPYCIREHRHGAVSGHRRAHCLDEESPFKETGYEIALPKELPALRREKARERRKLSRASKLESKPTI